MYPKLGKEKLANSNSRSVCNLCGETAANIALPLLDERSLVRCLQCGLVRLDPMPTPEELSKIYDRGDYYTTAPARPATGYTERLRNWVLTTFWNYPSSRTLSKFFLTIPLLPLRYRVMPVRFPGDIPVLDIGCGNGQRLLDLESYGCTQLYGVEPTLGAAEQARKATKATIYSCLLEDAGLPDKYFGLIILNQVLEHVPSPTETLNMVRNMLRPDGVLYITVPNFDALEASLFGQYWSGLQIPAHLSHFTPAPLRMLIEGAGLRITKWRTDTVLDVTRASVYNWKQAHPTVWRRIIYAIPQIAYIPLTSSADLLRRGQMLRVVAVRA